MKLPRSASVNGIHKEEVLLVVLNGTYFQIVTIGSGNLRRLETVNLWKLHPKHLFRVVGNFLARNTMDLSPLPGLARSDVFNVPSYARKVLPPPDPILSL